MTAMVSDGRSIDQKGVPTFAIHRTIHVEPGDVALGYGFKPNTLPNATTWCVKDVRWISGLLADWDIVALCIGRVVDVDSSTVC